MGVALRRSVVRIEWEDGEAEFVVRELTWGEMNEVIAASTRVEIVGGVPKTSFDLSRFREELLVRALERAPFTVTRESVRSLPARIAERLYREAEKLNPLPGGE